MARFGLLGVSGFVGVRHLSAIKANAGQLVMAADPFDSAGVLDRFFPESRYFKEENRFFAELTQHQRTSEPIDYVAICTPNYLHASQTIRALEHGVNVICEKPLVINLDDLEQLELVERQTNKRVSTILQLRYHPEISQIKRDLHLNPKRHHISVQYITPRGDWYGQSWKGDPKRSDGLAFNIGIHLFDLLIWAFGAVRQVSLDVSRAGYMQGRLELDTADVDWTLSINRADLPAALSTPTYRSLTCDGNPIDLSCGFTDLHTTCYAEILEGRGFGISDVRPSLELTSQIEQLASLKLMAAST